jgi:hypothetical protein
MASIQRRTLLVGSAALALPAPAIVRAQGQNGVALVIGNSKYQWESSLPNVKRDVPDIAKRFQALGLKTELLENLGREGMNRALERFADATRGARFAAFYFAGHGVYWDKQSYLVPVDADLADSKTVPTLTKVPSIDAKMKQAGGRMLVLDCCRNNPADGWRQKEARLAARVDAVDSVGSAAPEPNTLVLFSTAPGGTALDGPSGENSPFAGALIRQLDNSKVDIQALATKVRRELLLATDCRQLVWDHNTFAGPFVLDGTGKAAGGALRHDPARVLELPNAYAYAQKNGLGIPAGLVSYRPAAGSPDAEKIGSFSHQLLTRIGSQGAGSFPVPAMFIVLSVEETATAEVVAVVKNYQQAGGNRWRYFTAEKAARSIAWDTPDETLRAQMTWTGPNAGTFSGKPGRNFAGNPQSSPFVRLDG